MPTRSTTADPAVQGLQTGETLTEVFTYEITDADGDTATATLTLTITGTNDVPVATPDIEVTLEDTPLLGNVLTNDTDADGDTLTVTGATVDVDGNGSPNALVLGTPTALTNAGGDPIGTLTLGTDGAFTFTPAADYNGPVPVVTYTLTDGSGTDDTSTLTFSVDPVERRLHRRRRGGGGRRGQRPRHRQRCIDRREPSDGPVTLTGFHRGRRCDGVLGRRHRQRRHRHDCRRGHAAAAGRRHLQLHPGGRLQRPGAGRHLHPDRRLGHRRHLDPHLERRSGRTTTSPTPTRWSRSTRTAASNTGIAAHRRELAGRPGHASPASVGDATVHRPTAPARRHRHDCTAWARCEILADGTYNFTPAPDYFGPVPVATYTLTDGSGTDDTSTLTITVDPVNDDPVANPEAETTPEDTPVSGNVLSNDSDVEGDTLTVTAATVDTDGDGTPEALALGTATPLTNAAGDPIGTLTLGTDGAFTFTPAADYDGPVPQVAYTVADGNGGTASSTLDITITPVNDPPVANPDVVTTLEGAPVSGNLLTNDTDIDGGTLTVIAASVDTDGDGTPDALSLGVATVLTNAAGDPIGTLTLGTDGAFTFVPAAGYDGPVPQVTYTISDGNGGTARSTLDITLTPVEDTTNTDDVNRGVPFDPMDREERVRPRIAVDHIVVETANAANDLFGTPALLSDVYTSLGVRHPILTAINALQDLDGTAVLSTRGPEVFSGLVADGPVTQAVRSIGFDPIDDQYRLFNRDFSDGFQTDHADGFGEPAFGDTPSSLVTIQTRLGPIASFELAETAGSPEVLVSIAGAAGERLAILAVDAESLGDSRAVISDDGYSLRLCGLESGERIQFAVQLETGTWLAFELQHQDSDDRGERDTLVVTEQSAKTFTANTERLAYAGDIETAKLMQALR